MKFLIIACLLATVIAVQDKESMEAEEKVCIEKYFGSSPRCDHIIKYLEKELTAYFVGDTTFEWTVNCIKENMKKYNFLDFFLHKELEPKTDDINLPLQLEEISIKYAPMSLCRRSYGFDGHFEQFLEETKSNRGNTKYPCLHKYAIEKTIIEESHFTFDISAFDSLNCTEYYAKFDEKFHTITLPPEESPSEFKKCVDQKMAGYHFLRDLEVFMAIGTFDLTAAQKEKFKSIYWAWFSGGDRFIMECVRDVYKKD